MKSRSPFRKFLTALILMTIIIACGPFSPDSEKDAATASDVEPQSGAESISLISAAALARPFAEYNPPDVRLPQAFEGGYTLPLDLSLVKGMDAFDFSKDQLAALSQNGFFVSPPDPDYPYWEFYDIYESYRYEDQPLFVTTDSVLHVYHLLFDKILRDLEREMFMPALDELTTIMVNASQAQYNELRGTPLEEPALRNWAFFTVGAKLLGVPGTPPQEIADLVTAELGLINGHAGGNASPIWMREDQPEDKVLVEDYSQYIPRGHYTRSEEFERYFLAMMWYGRMTFRLRDSFETQRALLITHALRQASTKDGTPALTLWEKVFEPVGFIVGKADDPTFHEYNAISEVIFGESPQIEDYADQAKLDEFIQQAKLLPPPQVNSMWVYIWEDRDEATQGFRFMGQRFTLDAYLLGELIYRKVGTLENPRALPKGLDVFAAMGSEEAYNLLVEMGETDFENYDAQMSKVRSELQALELDSWTQNLYWAWLYVFQPIIEVKDERYPAFMQTQAWTRKDLQTVLGSWTELKHDTILYAKQVMAELGGGFDEEPPPHSYVEPNPQAFARLYALTEMTYTGLESRNMLDANTAGNLQHLMELIAFLQDIAERELRGEPISDEEYWRLQFFGGELEVLTIAAADSDESEGRKTLETQRTALIADVATGFGSALEEAVGNPALIYVVLPDEPFRVAVGAVFTYYEFVVSADQRMTDEEWKEMLDDGNNPPQPEWTSLFIIP